MIESREVRSVVSMKEHSRGLHEQAQIIDNEDGRIHKVVMVNFILPALMLFCLGMWGCEAQEDTSTAISDPINTGSEALVLQSHSPASPHSAEPLVRTDDSLPKIVAFGDSLTAGLGVAPDKSYPAQLAQLLQESGFQYEVINAGVSGETSAGGVRRIEWILKSRPTVVILELGVNDGLRGLPLKQTYRNLHTIIQRLKAEGAIVVLAGMRIPVNYGEEYTGEFFEMYERLAQEFALPLIPFLLKGVAAQPDLNQRDGVHPTGEGYALVAQNVWHTLEPILKELSVSHQTS
jgi:acyl-CoA thioesterase-1